jgi:hypothetical protein
MYCGKEEGPALARPAVSTIQNRHRSDHVALFQPDADIRFFSESALARPFWVCVLSVCVLSAVGLLIAACRGRPDWWL